MRIGQTVTLRKKERSNSFRETTDSGHYGKHLSRDMKNILTFGIWNDKLDNPENELPYKNGDDIDVEYTEAQMKYRFRAKVIDARRVLEEEENDLEFADSAPNDNINAKIDKYIYIIKMMALSPPEPANQREFFRMPMQMEIYFKDISEKHVYDMKDTYLKFEADTARMRKREADEGVLEDKAGYSRLLTADISAGGFMFKSPVLFAKAETYLDCMLIVDREAIPVIAKVLRSREDNVLDGYFVHVQFIKISEPVRDRLVKHLISLQKKQRRAMASRRRH